jgi:glycosyltransferase involved in cell wall biosynthesis
MEHVSKMCGLVDLYIAPSKYLMDRFIQDFSIEPSKMVYLDYGFHRERLQGRNRKKEADFIFGYIGTHKQAKGIFHLIQAFSQSPENTRLKIWGSPIEPFTQSLKSYAATLLDAQGFKIEKRIHWMGGYRNDAVVSDVFNHVDAIVVPSIWGENSPLVIHEALEAGVPVITADYGGMREYIQHEVNGLLFKFRDPLDLAIQMNRLALDPHLAATLAAGGYLQSDDRRIPCIKSHTTEILSLYQKVIKQRQGTYV